jgi:hypothetical protein
VPFVLPEGLAPEVYPLAWLVGEWRGTGVVDYPGIPQAPFTAHLTVTNDGGPYLAYASTLRLVRVPDDAAPDDAAPAAADDAAPDDAAADDAAADDAATGPVWADERGYWRVPPERPDDLPATKYPVELLVADPSGHVAVYLGAVGDGRIDLVSDLVARTATGAEVTAGQRLYGLVGGELMWVHELAAFGHPLQPYTSARLTRVDVP